MAIAVIHLLHRLTYGGSERLVVNLLKHPRGSVKSYICSLCDADMSFAEKFKIPRHLLFSLGKGEGNNFSIPFKIAALCRKTDAIVIHALGWGTYMEGLIAAKLVLSNRRLVFSFRGKTIEDTLGIPKRRIIAQRIFSPFCDLILTNSNESKSEYAEDIGIVPEKIRVVYNGVDVQQFPPGRGHEVDKLRKEFGIGKEEIVIGTVSRFDPVKNVGALIFAFAQAAKRNTVPCKLLLIGDGEEMPAIRRLATDLGITGSVIFGGMRDDVPQCLQLMDIYVQPSMYENIPNAIMEAMATGLPIIATDVGGIHEVVRNNETGLLVPRGDKDAMAKAIEFLMVYSDKRRQMGARGREIAVSQFSIERMVSDYEELFVGITR